MNHYIKKINDLKELFQAFKMHCFESEFRNWVLEGYHNPNILEVCSYGNEHRGKMIYQIDAYGCQVGFFAEFLYTLIRLYYANDRGFEPWVNWGREFLYYEPEGVEKEFNGFLYYFEQVSAISDINNAAYVIKANDYHIQLVQKKLNTNGYDVSEEYLDALSDMTKKYIRYNKKTEELLNQGYKQLIGNKKTLAVHFRGTDYRRQYNNHPVFVTIDEEIEKVRELIEKKGYELIFLATDEREAVNIFKKEFGDRVKVFEDTWRASDEDDSVAYSNSNREKHHYLLGLEVIRDQYMLTRCDGLVCGLSNLTLSARIMRRAWYEENYDDLVIINHNICHNEHNFCDATH